MSPTLVNGGGRESVRDSVSARGSGSASESTSTDFPGARPGSRRALGSRHGNSATSASTSVEESSSSKTTYAPTTSAPTTKATTSAPHLQGNLTTRRLCSAGGCQFLLTKASLSFDDAEKECVLMNGSLTSLHSVNDFFTLHDLARGTPTWLGLRLKRHKKGEELIVKTIEGAGEPGMKTPSGLHNGHRFGKTGAWIGKGRGGVPGFGGSRRRAQDQGLGPGPIGHARGALHQGGSGPDRDRDLWTWPDGSVINITSIAKTTAAQDLNHMACVTWNGSFPLHLEFAECSSKMPAVCEVCTPTDCRECKCGFGEIQNRSCGHGTQRVRGDFKCETCANAYCNVSEYQSGTCNQSANAYECHPCANKTCGAGEFRTGTCSGRTNGFVCHQCSHTTCPPLHYRSGTCSGTRNDFVCTKCANSVCGTKQYQDGACYGEINNFTCSVCSNLTCPTGTYQTGNCTNRENGLNCEICANISGPDAYRTGVCAGRANGFVLSPCSNTTCAQGQYQRGTCKFTDGYQCKTCSRRTCPAGKYRAGECSGRSDGYTCLACAPGRFSNSSSHHTYFGIAATAELACASCAPGRYQGASGQSACQTCDAGNDGAAGNSSVCTPCKKGRFDNDNSSHTPCVQCGPGMHQNCMGQTQCAPCSPGTAPDTVRAECELCPAGSYSTMGLTCIKCQGESQAMDDHRACEACSAGRSLNKNRTECIRCAAGLWSEVGQGCTACGLGSVPNKQGTACEHCNVGRLPNPREARPDHCIDCVQIAHLNVSCTALIDGFVERASSCATCNEVSACVRLSHPPR